MSELMNVQIEMWPLAADPFAVCLVSGDMPWMSAPIPQDSDPHFEAEFILGDHGIVDPPLIHSPSWRPSGPHIILAYFAVLDVPTATVLETWPAAKPISRAVLEGHPPAPHAANAAPKPHRLAVLGHAVRHVKFLNETDAGAARKLPPVWLPHLRGLQATLAGMYDPERELAS